MHHDKLRRASYVYGIVLSWRCRFVVLQGSTRRHRIERRDARSRSDLRQPAFFDYLPDSVAAVLLVRLAGFLRDHGRLLVGTCVDSTHVKWVPEFVLDWR